MNTITELYSIPRGYPNGPEPYSTQNLFNLIKGRESEGWKVLQIVDRADGTLIVYEVPA